MLCTAASGLKVPLPVIGKSKQPGAALKYELPQGQGPQLDMKTKMKHALIKTSLFGGSIKYFGGGMYASMEMFGHSFCLTTVLLTLIWMSHISQESLRLSFSHQISPMDTKQLIWE
jgi:hypothetical protein